LAWTDGPGPRPQRSEHELFEEVQRRAGTIRRGRRARLAAGLGTVVGVLAVATALAQAGDDPSSEMQVVGPPPTTSTSILVTTLPPPPLPTTTGPAPTTIAPAPATTRAPTISTTRLPATSTSTTVAVTLRQCDAADVVVTAAPERPSYARTERPTIVSTAVNRSSRPCEAPLTKVVEFFDSAGRPAGGVGVSISVSAEDVAGYTWAPGETLTGNMPGFLSCSDQPCLPGTYTAVMSFGPFRSPPATFTVT
jgi:hypothetical protein